MSPRKVSDIEPIDEHSSTEWTPSSATEQSELASPRVNFSGGLAAVKGGKPNSVGASPIGRKRLDSIVDTTINDAIKEEETDSDDSVS